MSSFVEAAEAPHARGRTVAAAGACSPWVQERASLAANTPLLRLLASSAMLGRGARAAGVTGGEERYGYVRSSSPSGAPSTAWRHPPVPREARVRISTHTRCPVAVEETAAPTTLEDADARMTGRELPPPPPPPETPPEAFPDPEESMPCALYDATRQPHDRAAARLRMEEMERRFTEQMTVHRGLTTAMRDVRAVAREARVLRAETRVTEMLALMRARQEAYLERAGVPLEASAGEDEWVTRRPDAPPSLLRSQPMLQRAHSPVSGGPLPSATTTTRAPPTAAAVPPPSTAPSTTGPASPLRELLETFSKPRRSPAPSGASAAVGMATPDGASLLQAGRGRPTRTHGKARVEVVDLRPEVPQPYARVYWVPPAPAAPAAPAAPRVHARSAVHSVADSESVYTSDFVEESTATGSVAEDIAEDATAEGPFSSRDGTDSVSMATSVLSDSLPRRGRTPGRRESDYSSVATSMTDDTASVSTVTGSLTSDAVSDADSSKEERHVTRERAGKAKGRAARRRGRSLRGDGGVPSGQAMAEALTEFYKACRHANRLAVALTDETKGLLAAAAAVDGASPTEERRRPRGQTRAGTHHSRPLRDDLQRLQRFGTRLEAHVARLDAEHAVRSAQVALLRRARQFARARRALTRDDAARLAEVAPAVARMLASMRAGEKGRPLQAAGKAGEKRGARTGAHPRSDGESILSEREASDILFLTRGARWRGPDSVSDAISDEIEDEFGLGSGGVASDGAISEVISEVASGSGVLDEDFSGIRTESDMSAIPDGSDEGHGGVESAIYSDSFEDSKSARGADSEGELEELEEAIDYAIDSLAVEHVFARARPGAGDSSVLDEVEEAFADRLASAGDSQLSELVEEAGTLLLDSGPLGTTSRSTVSESGAKGSVVTAPSSSAAASSRPTSSPAPTPTSSSSSSEGWPHPGAGGYALAREDLLSSAGSSAGEWGERELRHLEADLSYTRHRRRTALNQVDRGTRVGAEVPTFTQLYDPLDSELSARDSSYATEGSSGTDGDADVAPALRRPSGDVLLRLRALRQAAGADQRVYVVERDLLQSAEPVPTVEGGGLREGRPGPVVVDAGTSPLHSPAAASAEFTVPLSTAAADVTVTPANPPASLAEHGEEEEGAGAAESAAPHPESPQDMSGVAQPTRDGDGAGDQSPLGEDLLAMRTWKASEIALVRQLRPAAAGVDLSLDADTGDVTHHWNVLYSILATRFAPRGRADVPLDDLYRDDAYAPWVGEGEGCMGGSEELYADSLEEEEEEEGPSASHLTSLSGDSGHGDRSHSSSSGGTAST